MFLEKFHKKNDTCFFSCIEFARGTDLKAMETISQQLNAQLTLSKGTFLLECKTM